MVSSGCACVIARLVRNTFVSEPNACTVDGRSNGAFLLLQTEAPLSASTNLGIGCASGFVEVCTRFCHWRPRCLRALY